MRQKAIQRLLSRFRWSPGPSIFDRFLADLNRALSALFFKIGPQQIKNPPSPGGPPGGSKGGFWPHWARTPHLCPRKQASTAVERWFRYTSAKHSLSLLDGSSRDIHQEKKPFRHAKHMDTPFHLSHHLPKDHP